MRTTGEQKKIKKNRPKTVRYNFVDARKEERTGLGGGQAGNKDKNTRGLFQRAHTPRGIQKAGGLPPDSQKE